jgi:hypothetical protein
VVRDASGEEPVDAVIHPGTHEVEEISNPCHPVCENWLVLRGTKIGAAVTYWQSYRNPDIKNAFVIE